MALTAGQINYFLTGAQCRIACLLDNLNQLYEYDKDAADKIAQRREALVYLFELIEGYDPDAENNCITVAQAQSILEFIAKEIGVCVNWNIIPDSVYPICDLTALTGAFFYCDGLASPPTSIIVTSIDGTTAYQSFTYSWFAFNSTTNAWEYLPLVTGPFFSFGAVYIEPTYTMYMVIVICPGNSAEQLIYQFDRNVNPFTFNVLLYEISTNPGVHSPMTNDGSNNGFFEYCYDPATVSYFIDNPQFTLISNTPGPITPEPGIPSRYTDYQYTAIIEDETTNCQTQRFFTAREWWNDPVIYDGGGTTICDGGTRLLTAGRTATSDASFSTYQWYLNNTAIPGATNQTYLASLAGSYTVAVTNNSGACAAISAPVVLTIVANPAPNITATLSGSPMPEGTVITIPDLANVILDAGAGYSSYNWNGGLFATQTIIPGTAGVYDVLVTNANGCQGTDTFTVRVAEIFLDNIYESGPGSATIDILGTSIEPGSIPTFGPYSFRWFNSLNVFVGAGTTGGGGLSNTIAGLPPDDYTCQVTDNLYNISYTFGPVTIL